MGVLKAFNFKKCYLLLISTRQYEDLKANSNRVSNQTLELKAQNTSLSKATDDLNGKISNSESNTFERERCQSNLIFYRVPESSSSIVSERVAHESNRQLKMYSFVI